MTPERWRVVVDAFEGLLGVPPEQRAARLEALAAGDAGLSAEVGSLLAAHEAAGERFLDTPPLVAAVAPAAGGQRHRRVGPYELGEAIGRGGMGEVYEATRVDGQYTQAVAIKLVHAGFGAPLLIERFRTERQILASLEHVNIARLLDGGTSEDGVPYLVMERIVGVPIDAHCDARRLTITARLELFEQVCAAVAYAHRHLVIHRDVKPSNILVTEAGEPKLLDFGIAKMLDAPGSPETTMLRPMTPEFASPEQLRGAAVTTATDIYSLGVVLYRLLTGRSPYPVGGGDARGLDRLAAGAAPPAPSSVVVRPTGADPRAAGPADLQQLAEVREGSPARLQRRLRGDLDDIVLKALRAEPDRRYTSVEQFAEDIRRHLAGLPVFARHGSWRYRAGKFLYRHRAIAAASGLALVALVSGTVVALHEADIAARNARRAEARFNDVRALANALIFEIHDAIEPLPGATPVRELIVKRALEYLDRLSREAGGDVALRRELALAYEKVGDVQGVPSRSNLGSPQGALQSYRKALAIRSALSAAAPRSARLRVELAHDYGEIGDLVRTMGDLKGSLETYRQGLAELAAIDVPTADARAEQRRVELGYGVALASGGELKQAIESFTRAVAIGEALAQERPDDAHLTLERAIALKDLGDGYIQMGRLNDALQSFRAGQALLAPGVAAGRLEWRRDVGVLEERLANALTALGKTKEALLLRQKVLEDDLETERSDPANARARRDVYIDYYKLARTQFLAGDIEDAIANERRSLGRIDKELAANPANAITQDDAQIGNYYLGEMLHKAGRPLEALQSLRRSQAISEQMMTANPNDLTIRADYAEGERKVGDMELAVGHRQVALTLYRGAVEDFEALVARNPTNSVWRSALAMAYEHLGHFYAIEVRERTAAGPSGARSEASGWLRKSLTIWNDLRSQSQLVAEDAEEPASVARQLAALEAVGAR
jgi:serine/threonine protein kinase/tetratricopeptide (TPR) repeat protein